MMMKRPAGNRPETPGDLARRLSTSWPVRLAEHLSGKGRSQEDGQTAPWPLHVGIGRPRLTADTLLGNAAAIRHWIDAWTTVPAGCDITHEQRNTRTVGRITIPDRIAFATIDDLAGFLGASASHDLTLARRRFRDLRVIDPRLMGLAASWPAINDLSEIEHDGTCDFLSRRSYDSAEILSVREMILKGLDGKFIEAHRNILQGALAHMGKLRDSSDFRERLGFRSDDRRTLWVKAHPADMTGPFGTAEFAVRPGQIAHFPDSIRQISIVENIESFFGYEPDPGVCLFFGSGNAITGMARDIPALMALDVIYWGDLDTFGMKILSQLRRTLPHVRSVMMDATTMTGLARNAWRHEPEKDRYRGDISGLTEGEEAALALLRRGNHRIEQEHLRPGPGELCTLGIHRAEKSPG